MIRWHVQEDHSEAPNLQIEPRSQELRQREGFQVSILAIIINASHDKVTLLLVKELPGFGRPIGEVHQEDIAEQSDSSGDLVVWLEQTTPK